MTNQKLINQEELDHFLQSLSHQIDWKQDIKNQVDSITLSYIILEIEKKFKTSIHPQEIYVLEPLNTTNLLTYLNKNKDARN